MLSLLPLLAMGLVPHSQSLIASEGRGNYPRVMLAQAQVPDSPAFIAPRQRSAADLHLELEDLQAAMPSVGGPVAMLVSGGVVALGGFIFAYAGLLVAAFDGGAWLLVGSLLGLGAGIALVVVGVVLLVKVQRQRRAITKDLETVRRELRNLEQPSEGPPSPGPYPGTFTPPPPPPQVEGPHASILLAEF